MPFKRSDMIFLKGIVSVLNCLLLLKKQIVDGKNSTQKVLLKKSSILFLKNIKKFIKNYNFSDVYFFKTFFFNFQTYF